MSLLGEIRSWVRVAVGRVAYGGWGRDRRQQPERVLAALGVQQGQRVVDVGSGTGYFTLRLARAVAPSGVVYAIDTDRDLLGHIERVARREGLPVRPVLAEPHRPALPEPVDVAFLSHSYHHLPDRPAYLPALRELLRTGGRVGVVESLPRKDWLGRWSAHTTDPDALRREMEDAGFVRVAEHDWVERATFQVFEVAPRTAS